MGGSLIGVTSNMLETDASWAKTQWTYALRFLNCLPLAIVEAFYTRKTYWTKLKTMMKQRKIVIGILVTPLL